jgi:UDP-N-acetylglucosamine:LPS N-acetylglucosamine transferase
MTERRRKKILAVASGGGHWIQLLRLRPAFEGHGLVYITAAPPGREEIGPARLYIVNDANRWTKFALMRLALKLILILIRERPNVIVSTGAAPGCIAVIFGKLLGARTIWLDSLANAERLSMSGRIVRPFADMWLTQWPDLARPGGPKYEGAVL